MFKSIVAKLKIPKLNYKFSLILEKNEDWLFLLIGLALALALRLLLRGYVSGDAVTGSLPWYDYIESHQGIEALKHNFSGYPPLYLYMLVASYYINQFLNLSHLAAIKSISIVFDFFAAFWFGKIVQLKYPGKTVSFCAALAFLFLPTVFMNGPMWGQIDGIFTSFLLASMYYLLKQRDMMAMVAFGLGLSIKFQAIFLAPFLLVLFLLRKLSFRSLLLAPAVVLITLVPSWIIGRPLDQLLMIYVNQVGSFDALTLDAPTFYALIDNSVNYLFNLGGVIIAAAIVMIAVFTVYKMRPFLKPDLLVGLAAACLLLVTYILPMMHERYFFPAEVFFLLFAFYRPRIAFVPIGLQITALVTYSDYFFGRTFLPLTTDSLIMLALLVFVLYDIAKMLIEGREEAKRQMPTGSPAAPSSI
jgi:Gpi18-like mannosyltransferase